MKEINQSSFNDLFGTTDEYIDCVFKSVDFTANRLTLLKFIDCTFVECNLSNTELKNATFRSCRFENSKCLGLNFSTTHTFAAVEFVDSQLDYSSFQTMNIKKCVFQNCSLKEVEFSEADCTSSDFSGSKCSGANFTRANLSHCDFRRATEYNIEPTYTVLTKAKFSGPEVLSLLRSFDIIIE